MVLKLKTRVWLTMMSTKRRHEHALSLSHTQLFHSHVITLRSHRHAPGALYPRERPGTYCTGGWVGPRTGLDRCGKISPPPGFDPRTVQPVASRYTDCATRPNLRSILPSYSGGTVQKWWTSRITRPKR